MKSCGKHAHHVCENLKDALHDKNKLTGDPQPKVFSHSFSFDAFNHIQLTREVCLQGVSVKHINFLRKSFEFDLSLHNIKSNH